MKKLLLLFTFMGFASGIFAQVSKTLNLATAGTLSTSLTTNELSTIVNFTLTGNMDARDFKTMRDKMPSLAVLDLSGVKVAAYTGKEGTKGSSNTNYEANIIPAYAFVLNGEQKTSLKSVVLPSSVISIGNSAFAGCIGLTSVTIPSSVTSIGDDAFYNCIGLTSVTIPSSVISIGNSAFSDCYYLTSITIPSSVTSIGDEAFAGCRVLTSITIPSSVTSIGEFTFIGCRGLTSITIPSSVTSIGVCAFDGCSGLTSITIPSSVTSIGKSAFNSCSGLTSVTIPSSVTIIGEGAFGYCGGLITVDTNNPNYSSLNGALYDKTQTEIIQCPTSKIGSFTIPSSVTSIGYGAFAGCSRLISITIPSSVKLIGDHAFLGCSGLTSITTTRTKPVDLSNSYSVFEKIDKTTCILYVPVGSKSTYQAADQWKEFTNIVEKVFTGIDPIISDQKLTFYPNPTTGKVNLVFDQIPKMGTNLIVKDLSGKTIHTQFIQNKEEWIDLGGNSPGVYLISTDMKDFIVQKIILK